MGCLMYNAEYRSKTARKEWEWMLDANQKVLYMVNVQEKLLKTVSSYCKSRAHAAR